MIFQDPLMVVAKKMSLLWDKDLKNTPYYHTLFTPLRQNVPLKLRKSLLVPLIMIKKIS